MRGMQWFLHLLLVLFVWQESCSIQRRSVQSQTHSILVSAQADPAHVLGSVLTKDGQSSETQMQVAALVSELTQEQKQPLNPQMVPRDPQAGVHLRLVPRVPCGTTEVGNSDCGGNSDWRLSALALMSTMYDTLNSFV